MSVGPTDAGVPTSGAASSDLPLEEAGWPVGAADRSTHLADLAELVRLPAVVTIPGDAWAGAAASGWRRGWGMPAASALLYLGGMALNDWADRDLDAIERPERPIPSGRVEATTALAVASGLLAGGVAVAAAVGGPRATIVAVPLAASVVAYDQLAKDTALGPVVMATCRGLDVAMGAVGASPAGRVAALPAIGAAVAHTLGVTQLSRHEVHGGAGPSARLAGGLAAVAALLAQADAWREDPDDTTATRWLARGAAALAAVDYLRSVGTGYRAAAARPDDPDVVQAAVGGGVMGNTTLQASSLAASRAWPAAGLVAVARRGAGLLRRVATGGSVT